MHDNLPVARMVSGREIVEVEYAAAAVFCRVHENDDMLVGQAGEGVVQLLDVERGEIAVAVECGERRTECRRLPFVARRDAGAAVG